MKQIIAWSLRVTIGVGISIYFAATSHAQNLVYDGTLGEPGEPPGRQLPSAGRPFRYDIRSGRGLSVGNNLFHSFSRFNLAANEEASFQSDANIKNIFVRITGGQPSDIQGRILLSQFSDPNFFIINPSGIRFGQNARLDNIIQEKSGSIVATTLDAIQFPNGKFSAVNPEGRDSLLKIVGDPSGFIASQRQPGDMTIATRNRTEGNSKSIRGLLVAGGENLLLLGGNILFENSLIETAISKDKGLASQIDGMNFQVASVRGAGNIELTRQNDRWQLDIPNSTPRGDVRLQNSEISIRSITGGSLAITANNLIATDSRLVLTVKGDKSRPPATGGNVELNASDSIVFERSIVSSEVTEEGNAQGGNLNLVAQKLISRNSQIRTDSFGTGNAGNLTVTAPQLVDLSGEYQGNLSNDINNGPGGLFSQVNKTGIGNGGNLSIETSLLRVQNGSKVQTATFGTGDAGNITITAGQVEVLDDRPKQNFPTAINAGVTLTLQSEIDALGKPQGNAGNLNITADSIKVNGGSITVANFGVGQARNITGGNIKISARDRISLDNKGEISATTESGQGGNITLSTNNFIFLRRGSTISTNAGTPKSGGDGGNITLNAPWVLARPIENSDITANAFNGRGGNIEITTRQLFGLEFRSKNTNKSDITASSNIGLEGTFILNKPDIDPNRGLVQLPTAPTDPSDRIDQTCAANASISGNQFVVTGHGGLPASPTTIHGTTPITRLVTLPTQALSQSSKNPIAHNSPATFIEAQAAIRQINGKVRLLATTPDTASRSRLRSNCQ